MEYRKSSRSKLKHISKGNLLQEGDILPSLKCGRNY